MGVGVLAVAGCSGGGPNFVAEDEPWRQDVELACLQSGTVHESGFVAGGSALGGPSPCGAVHPFQVSALEDGYVQLAPTATLQCGMIPALERWMRNVADPAAFMYLGSRISRITVAASYSCRPMNNIDGARLSEHGHANAIDISAFTLADGRTIKVLTGWRGSQPEAAFLHSVHNGACGSFTTVLGPDANSYHRDHLHLDLARHHRGRAVCE